MTSAAAQQIYCGSCGNHKPRYAFPDGELLPCGRTRCNSCAERAKKQAHKNDAVRDRQRERQTKHLRGNLESYMRGLGNPK